MKKRVVGKILGIVCALLIVMLIGTNASYAKEVSTSTYATETVSMVQTGSTAGLSSFFGWIGNVTTKIVAKIVNIRSVTYTDNLLWENAFDTEVYVCQKGDVTPTFQGNAERKGYVFAGWYPEVRPRVDASMVYYAQWKKLYNVEIELYRNGDHEHVYKTVSLPQMVEGEKLDVSKIDINDYYSSEYGFEFSGWYDASLEGEKISDAVLANKNIKIAGMVTDKLLVTYTDGAGETVFANQSALVLYGTDTPEFAGESIRDDYQFMGWTPAVEKQVTENVTYTANWEFLQYVNLVLFKNGETEPSVLTTLDRVINGTEIKVSAIDVNTFYSSEEGFKFDGFVNENGEAYGDTVVANGTTTIVGYVTDYHSVSYSDGTEDEVFETENYIVLHGDKTPSFAGLTDREGYVFRGWNVNVPETVTEKLAFTADYIAVPLLPSVKNQNVVGNIVKDVCDSDPEHVPGFTNFTASAKVLSPEPVYVPELKTFEVEVSFSDANLHFTTPVKRANGNISHDYVTKTINGKLIFDEATGMWVPKEEIVFHTTCRTAPGAPLAGSVTSGNQIKCVDITGEAANWFITVKSGTYTVSEVYGNRKEGFNASVTVELDPDGAYANEFRTKRGAEYVVATDLTPKNFTYQLMYTGSLTGTLPAKPTQAQWKYAGPGSRLANECVIYMTKPATVTYTDGIGGASFADQTYEVLFGDKTPEFVSEELPVREGYTFDGFYPVISETVDKINTVYEARWMPVLPDRLGKNVTPELFKVICDSVEEHAPVVYKWGNNPTVVSKVPEWNEELGTYTCDIKYNDVTFVMVYERTVGRIPHTTKGMQTATLKWSKEQSLWVPVSDEPIPMNTTCDCAHTPYAPSKSTICSSTYQFKFSDVTGANANWFVKPVEGTYSVGEVKGDNKNGYTVDITINFADDDVYFAQWKAKRGDGYRYDWDKTPKSYTFTLKYSGALDGVYRKTTETSWKYAGPDTRLANALTLYVTTEPLSEDSNSADVTEDTPSISAPADNVPEITTPGAGLGGNLGDLDEGTITPVKPIKPGIIVRPGIGDSSLNM